ncbi:MAG: hypothetical protein HQL88_02770 [Magnetococcales bacterium]|nr:hypothetical protein [Magnetococcales bacterium]
MKVDNTEAAAAVHLCPHCDQPTLRWRASQNEFGDGMGFCTDVLLVCFNDECPMFVKGWNSLFENYRRVGSVRYFYDAGDGTQGVLPVAHKSALRGDIIQE